MGSAKLRRAACSRCGRAQAVRGDGTMFSHGDCPGGVYPLGEPEGVAQQAADLLSYGTHDEQVQAVASALRGTRLQALTEGWFAAAYALRDQDALAAWRQERRRIGEPFEGTGAADYLESLSGQTPAGVLPTPPSAGSNETGETDG